MRIQIVIVLIIVGFITSQNQVYGQKTSINGLEVANPKQLEVLVEVLKDAAKNIGLTEKRIVTKYELKLRQYGIEPLPPVSNSNADYLYININVGSSSYSINIDFVRYVHFQVSKITYEHFSASTWNISSQGSHGNDPEFIISALDKYLDSFINDYLKANPSVIRKN